MDVRDANQIIWQKLGDVITVQRGASPRPISKFITKGGGVAWVKIGDVSLNSKYVKQTAQKITQEGAERSRYLKKGDFIISNSMSFGRPYIMGIDGCIHDGWASLSEYEENFASDFLYYYLSSDKVQKYWDSKVNVGGVGNLNSDIIKSLDLPIVSEKVQNHVVQILDKFDTLTSDITKGLPKEIELRQKQYEYYRDKLLTFEK